MHKCKQNAQNNFLMHTIHMDTFGERLRKLRDEKKVSQQDLAEYLGKGNKTVISSWELNKAKPSMDDIVLISEFFQTTTDYLLKGSEKNEVKEPDGEYVKVKKDDFMALQKRVIEYQEKEIEELKEKEQNLKNISLVQPEA